ncbi:UNVERIFIED_CONTAM: Dynactin subunit 2 [Siphonaria sp. JEL0065]|nr:Dynactin subunit 2 [Siphonaria sp. JEL0065]
MCHPHMSTKLRRVGRPLEIDATAQDVYESGTPPRSTPVSPLNNAGSGAPAKRMPPPLPDRALLVHSAIPLNTATISAAVSATQSLAEADFSGKIRDIPRPLVLVGAGRGSNVLGALSPQRAALLDGIEGDADKDLQDDGDKELAYFGSEGKLARLAKLVSEAKALEEVVAVLKKKDDVVEEARRLADEEEKRLAEQRKRERAMDAWLHMDSSEDEDEVKEVPPPKPARKGMSNAKILELISELHGELNLVAENIKKQSPIVQLMYQEPNSNEPKPIPTPSTFFDPSFKEHLSLAPDLAHRLYELGDSIMSPDEYEQFQQAQLDKEFKQAVQVPAAAALLTSPRPSSTPLSFPTSPTQSILSPLQATQSLISPFHQPSNVLPPLPDSATTIQYQLTSIPPSTTLPAISQTHHLESRLASLESRLGIHYLKLHDTSTQPTIQKVLQTGNDSILGALDRLDHQLGIVSDVHVMREMVEEVGIVCGDMRRLIDVKKVQMGQIETMNNGFLFGGAAVGGISGKLQQHQQLQQIQHQKEEEEKRKLKVENPEGVIKSVDESSSTSLNTSPSPKPAPLQFQEHAGKRSSVRISQMSSIAAHETMLSDLKKQTRETETEKRVHHLYTRVHSLDTVISDLPYLVYRLHGLRGVHEQANELSERLNTLVSEQMKTVDAVRGAESLLRTVEDGLKANSVAVEQNFEALETRLKGLMERVERGY